MSSHVILGSPGAIPGCGPFPVPPGVLLVSQVTCAAALNPTAILVSIGNNDALQALTLEQVAKTDPLAPRR